jgi:hypothetical protein
VVRTQIKARYTMFFTNVQTQPPVQWLPGLFPGSMLSGRGVNHPPPSSAEVKNECNRTFIVPMSCVASYGKSFVFYMSLFSHVMSSSTDTYHNPAHRTLLHLIAIIT